MIPNPRNGPKSTHGAGPGSNKHNTMCTLACLTPLLYAMHGNSSHYVSGGYLIKYAQNAEKTSINVCVKAPQQLVNVYQLFSLRKHRIVWVSFTDTNL